MGRPRKLRTEEVPPEPTGPGRVYGYVRVSIDRQALSPEVQREQIRQAADRNGLVIDALFQDAPVEGKDGAWNDAQSGKTPFPERPAGRELYDRLRRGDVVIAAKLDRLFRKLSDMVILLDRWERWGIRLVVNDFPALTNLADPYQKAMVQMLGVFAELERKLISQRTKEALALRKRKGIRHNRYPGYGRTFESRLNPKTNRREKVAVRCESERHVMGLIAQWRIQGHTWDAITDHLREQGVVTKDGRPWSKARVFRVFKVELALQAAENQAECG